MSLAQLLLAVTLLAAAGAKPGRATAADLADGALRYLVGRACEKSLRPREVALDWPALGWRNSSWAPVTIDRCYVGVLSLSHAAGSGALWAQSGKAAVEANQVNLYDAAQTRRAFEAEFGWALADRSELAGNVFLTYRSKKIVRLFNRAYLKPTDEVAGVRAQEIYDVVLKEAVTKFARDIAFIEQNVTAKQLQQLIKEYKITADEQGARFYGPQFLRTMAGRVLPEDPSNRNARSGRTLGTMLRRKADGTWGTVTDLLKKVLRDYDPALARELRGKI